MLRVSPWHDSYIRKNKASFLALWTSSCTNNLVTASDSHNLQKEGVAESIHLVHGIDRPPLARIGRHEPAPRPEQCTEAIRTGLDSSGHIFLHRFSHLDNLDGQRMTFTEISRGKSREDFKKVRAHFDNGRIEGVKRAFRQNAIQVGIRNSRAHILPMQSRVIFQADNDSALWQSAWKRLSLL